jgi:hypothetical protein
MVPEIAEHHQLYKVGRRILSEIESRTEHNLLLPFHAELTLLVYLFFLLSRIYQRVHIHCCHQQTHSMAKHLQPHVW